MVAVADSLAIAPNVWPLPVLTRMFCLFPHSLSHTAFKPPVYFLPLYAQRENIPSNEKGVMLH